MSSIVLICGLIFVAIAKMNTLVKNSKISRIASFSLMVIVVLLIGFLEKTFKLKSNYNPLFYPPDSYIKGSYKND